MRYYQAITEVVVDYKTCRRRSWDKGVHIWRYSDSIYKGKSKHDKVLFTATKSDMLAKDWEVLDTYTVIIEEFRTTSKKITAGSAQEARNLAQQSLSSTSRITHVSK